MSPNITDAARESVAEEKKTMKRKRRREEEREREV